MTTRGLVPERSTPLALPKVCGARPRRAISWLAWRTCSRRDSRSMAYANRVNRCAEGSDERRHPRQKGRGNVGERITTELPVTRLEVERFAAHVRGHRMSGS